MADEQIIRPTPLQWLRYVYTGSVPRKNEAWVLYDVTCRTWILRHIVRFLFLLGPLILAVVIFLPASGAIRAEAAGSAGCSILIAYLCFTTEALEHRVEKAGYPHGLAQKMREQRAIASQRAVAARSRERRALRR